MRRGKLFFRCANCGERHNSFGCWRCGGDPVPVIVVAASLVVPLLSFMRIVIGTIPIGTALGDGLGAFHHQ
jgi:hypothetical protein